MRYSAPLVCGAWVLLAAGTPDRPSAAPAVGGTSLHISPTGDDRNAGTREEPFATLARARSAIREIKHKRGLPRGGVTVWIRGGLYRFATPLELGPEDAGTEQAPIVYRSCVGEEAIFDGSRPVDTTDFRVVDDEATLARLTPKARGQVRASGIGDPKTIELLTGGAVLSLDGKMMQYARFPNRGFAHLAKILDKGAVYAHGRTKGDPPVHSKESPIGGEFTLREEPSGDWAREYQVNQNARVSGYLAYDWYRQNHRVARIADGKIKLQEYSRYGIQRYGKMPRRLVVTGLLCEVDQPGEWYFDDRSNTLFVWPFGELDASTNLGLWAGPAFAVLKDTAHVTIRDLTVMSVSDPSHKAMIYVEGGHDNLIAGCTLKNSTRTAVWIEGGTHNGLQGCDLYDVTAHLNLYGGDTKTLTPARNFAVNCHFTQVQATDFYGRIAIRGVGHTFRNNLVHNFIGQPITLGGNDHLIELNEVFNVGIEEGDGGAMYSGAAMWSYGNVYRHNFLHHLMCVPQAHPRGGIYPDDHDAGDTIVENVFYKAAHRAVLLNGGAAHTVARNVFLNGYIGIYSTSAFAEKAYENIAKFDSGELKRGDKGDHIWRTEQVVGKEGWNKPPWSTKYPLFAKVMNQPKRRFFPIECRFVDNLFHGNDQNMQFRTGWGKDDVTDPRTVPYLTVSGNRDIGLDLFDDAGKMNFAFRRENRPDWVPDIPFDRIGLCVDEYRPHVPDKAAYRNAVRERFKDRPCFDPDAKYDPATINEVLYFNTGKLIVGSQ